VALQPPQGEVAELIANLSKQQRRRITNSFFHLPTQQDEQCSQQSSPELVWQQRERASSLEMQATFRPSLRLQDQAD
jgi:hypothetical protein